MKLEEFLREWIDAHSTKSVEQTPLGREWYKILYKVGAVTFAPPYVNEPINWNVIREATYGRFKKYLG